MSFFDLERAIRRGVSQGIGRAVGDAIGKAIEPTATDLANKAAGHIDNAAGNQNGGETKAGGFQGAFANLERSVNNYATEAAKNMKVCPNCEKPTTADKKFCPECGTALPEQTVAEGAVCTACGKQNAIGTKFCQDCGAKLPSAIAEEQAQADKNAKIMAEWDEKLSAYPKWNCGGSILMNLKALRKTGFVKNFIAAMRFAQLPRTNFYCAETILNVCFRELIQQLELRWNYCHARRYSQYPDAIREADARIIHFIGPDKSPMKAYFRSVVK